MGGWIEIALLLSGTCGLALVCVCACVRRVCARAQFVCVCEWQREVCVRVNGGLD